MASCTPTATTVTTLRYRVLFFGSLHSSNLASRATATYHYVHCSTHVNLHVLCRTINIVVSCCCSRRQRHCGGAARQLFLTVFVVTAVQIGTSRKTVRKCCTHISYNEHLEKASLRDRCQVATWHLITVVRAYRLTHSIKNIFGVVPVAV